MPKRARNRLARGKGVQLNNPLKARFTSLPSNRQPVVNDPPSCSMPGHRCVEFIKHSFLLRKLVEASKFYLVVLTLTAFDLIFVYAWFWLDHVFEVHLINPLPFGPVKALSISLILVLHIVTFYMVVKFNFAHIKSIVEQIE